MKQVTVTDTDGQPIVDLSENDFGQIEGVAVHSVSVRVDGNMHFEAQKKSPARMENEILRDMVNQMCTALCNLWCDGCPFRKNGECQLGFTDIEVELDMDPYIRQEIFIREQKEEQRKERKSYEWLDHEQRQAAGE